ncbi:hypothetical protein IAD21_02049 [Abditibacteriota bacterium]|nr:hypothetical protein IAD21_02049 [Abditibacteriota bacterium]
MFSWQRSERDPLWRREMRERWRRPITLLFLTLYAVGLSWAAYSLYSSIVPPGNVELGMQSRGIGRRLFLELLKIQILVWIPVAFLLGAPAVAAERERRALTDYLLAGLQSRQIVRAKFASISTFIVVMCAIPLPLLTLCFPLGGVEPLELICGFLLEIAVATVCASIGLLISTGNKRVTGAMQNAVILALIFLFLGMVIVPGLLLMSFWVWLTLAGFLAGGTVYIMAGCDDTLRIVSHNLEMEEPGGQLPNFSFSPIPVAPPDGLPTLPSSPAKAGTDNGSDVADVSFWDIWAEKLSGWNAVAQREVRVGIRESRRRAEFAPPTSPFLYSLWAWVASGLCGAIMVALSRIVVWLYLGLAVMTLIAVIAATLGSSAAFTREREQKMLAQLRVCPLSPLEVVAGKMGAILLLVARSWGGPLLALLLAGLGQGVFIAFEISVFVVLTLVFAVALATLLSLVCHRTAIAASTALGILFVVFVVLPVGSGPLVYFLPVLRGLFSSFPLRPLWIEPMTLLSSSSVGFPTSSLSPAAALFRLVCSLLVADGLLIIATTYLWSHTTPDDGQVKRRFWERDISRSWR